MWVENHCLTKTLEFRLFNTSYFGREFWFNKYYLSSWFPVSTKSWSCKCFNSWGRIPLGSLSPTRRFLMNHCLGVSCAAGLRPHPALTVLQPLVHAVGQGILDGWGTHLVPIDHPLESPTLLLLETSWRRLSWGPCFDRFGWKPSRSSLASGTWNKWSIDAHSLCLGFIPQISTEIFGVWPEIWQKEVEISRFGGSSSLIVGGQFGNLPNLAANLCQMRQLCWERMRHHPGRRHGQWGQMMAMGCPCDFVCRHNNVWLGLLWSLRCWG